MSNDRDRTHRRFSRAFAGHAGYRPHYVGRHYIVGPALAIARDGLSAVLRVAGMPVQWDRDGEDRVVVYPE